MKNVLIFGGAGFLGSHLVDHLLALDSVETITVIDKDRSRVEAMRTRHSSVPLSRLILIDMDLRQAHLLGGFPPIDTIIHLASNADIAAAASNPRIDFDDGTALTQAVCEFARLLKIKRILYASGSGVYGEVGGATEDYPYAPISTYGASKVAGEMLLRAYCHMFGIGCAAFRFANIVGPRQTHGVGYDFLRKLKADPTRLEIKGDGRQTKGYLWVGDAISAMLCAENVVQDGKFEAYNVAPRYLISVSDIADMACGVAGADIPCDSYVYTGGSRGWSGDVPNVALPTYKIRALGWESGKSSGEAMNASLIAMQKELS